MHATRGHALNLGTVVDIVEAPPIAAIETDLSVASLAPGSNARGGAKQPTRKLGRCDAVPDAHVVGLPRPSVLGSPCARPTLPKNGSPAAARSSEG